MKQAECPELLPGTLYMMVLRTLRGGRCTATRLRAGSRKLPGGARNRRRVAVSRLEPHAGEGWLAPSGGYRKTTGRRVSTAYPAGKKQLQRESSQFERLVQAIRLVMKSRESTGERACL